MHKNYHGMPSTQSSSSTKNKDAVGYSEHDQILMLILMELLSMKMGLIPMVQRVVDIIRIIQLRLKPKMLMCTECLMSTWIAMYMVCLMSTWMASTIIQVIINHPMLNHTALVV